MDYHASCCLTLTKSLVKIKVENIESGVLVVPLGDAIIQTIAVGLVY